MLIVRGSIGRGRGGHWIKYSYLPLYKILYYGGIICITFKGNKQIEIRVFYYNTYFELCQE